MNGLKFFLIRSNLFVALCATSLAWQTQILLQVESNWYENIIILFLSTLFIYNFHRLVKNRNPLIGQNNVGPTLFTDINFQLSLISLVTLIFSVLIFSFTAWVSFIIGGSLAVAYSIPLIRWNKRRYSFRTLPFFKLFVVVIVWTLMTVMLPIEGKGYNENNVYLILLERIFFLLAITLPFDIKDLNKDKQEKIKTIPISFGWRNSIAYSNLFMFIFSLIIIYGYSIDAHSLIILCALLLSAIIGFLIIAKSRTDSNIEHYALKLEGVSLVQSLLVWIAYLLDCYI